MTDLEDVAGGFVLAVSKLRRRLQQLPVESGVSMPEMTALVRLDRAGPQTSSALAKGEQISPQAMGVTITTLEGRGLVSRAADPADGRRVLWSLTPEGRDVVVRKRGARIRQVAEALGALTDEEVTALRAAVPVIDRLAERL